MKKLDNFVSCLAVLQKANFDLAGKDEHCEAFHGLNEFSSVRHINIARAKRINTPNRL